ncbi:unnamed protein product [Adineta ricciae]|uniref:C2 domain-containing protein n=1 Tax=Adineta ricciae TaxID=249248 RepID=A0A813T1N8_ADIRI|nr:unnamed protein product [Adineta ricciae]
MTALFKSAKATKRSKGGGGGGAALMQQMGFQIPNFDEPNIGADDDDDDEGLEDELSRIQEEISGHTSKRSKSNQKKPGGSAQNLQSFHNDVNKLLNDIDRPINDAELSEGDEEDLLNELNEITDEIGAENQMDTQPPPPPPAVASSGTPSTGILSTLEVRRQMYAKAVDTAKAHGDASKSRRLDRQLKLIQELIQSARTGAPINESEIPPELFVSGSSSSAVTQEASVRVPSPAPVTSSSICEKPIVPQATSTSVSNGSDEAIARLKALALQAKSEGDMTKAKEYLIQMKNLQNGISVNHASESSASTKKDMSDKMPNETSSAAPSVPLEAPEPKTVLEALQQRHEELTKRHQDAVSKGDNSKARRMDRLSKQYQEAIEATKKGRPYDYSELADLPGFAPIPFPQSKPQQTASGTAATTTVSIPARPSQPQQQRSSQLASTMSQPVEQGSTTSLPRDQSVQSIRLQQEQLQKLALQAKQKGDIAAAKKYLIASKELEQKSNSSETLMPMETNQASISSSHGFEVICDQELTEELAQADRDTVYRRLQDDLLRQMQLCARNQQMYAQMEGLTNVQHANEFKLLEQRCTHDLERLRQCFQHGLKAPIFHYEKRQMHIVQVNNDLTDSDFEVNVLRGINLHVPSGYSATALETYVIIEFPYPPETSQTARTRHAAGSANVEYPDALHKFQIKRNDTKFKRLMGRKELKLSIYYKVGFLRSDRLLGVAYVKTAPLEQSATIHESVDVFENDHKKKAEGKLEVKIRIKEALGSTKSSQISSQQWLVIDRFEDIPHDSKPSTSNQHLASNPTATIEKGASSICTCLSPSTAPTISTIARLIPTSEAIGLLAVNLAGNNDNDLVDGRQTNTAETKDENRRDSQLQAVPQSIQVLKYETDLLQDQIEQLEEYLSPDQIDQLRVKHQALKDESDNIVRSLRQGGKQALQDHIQNLRSLLEHYDKEANDYRQRNENKKADIALHKKELVAGEIETLTN